MSERLPTDLPDYVKEAERITAEMRKHGWSFKLPKPPSRPIAMSPSGFAL